MMELTNGLRREGSPLCSGDRILPQIGPNHQVTMPPLKQSARIASLEYINRDQWYACGLAVPIIHIAASPSWRKSSRSLSAADQEDKSLSLASTSNSNSRTNNGVQGHPLGGGGGPQIPCAASAAEAMMGSKDCSKDANSCASSSKETCQQAWKKEESSSLTLGADVAAFRGGPESAEEKAKAMGEDYLPGLSGQSELKSSITSVVQGGSTTMIMKKRKKRRSCWQPLKRKGGNKKAKIEKGKMLKRWSGSLNSEVVVAEEEGQGSAEGGGGGGGLWVGVGEEREEGRGRVLPGGQPDSWSEEEVAGFTLALYLFDKDFCAIKRFLGTKKMKDLLHFYYGKFYSTPAFCRWAGSKNSRNRKFVHGPRILQGWRQDELLRRLLPHFSDAAMVVPPRILQAVKSFNEREMTVEGLAIELKVAVGLYAVVHCVGIGVPKRDLTAVHGDPTRHGNHLNHLGGGGAGGGAARVESAAGAAGKACSTLTKEEMLECLTGDFRISKTRAQDLFWEAVWPRLLAHGWHSTECDTPQFPGSKNPLLFLRPGVTKISKGSSERGVHYFDSVSEVLKAVADDPSILDGVGEELTGDTMEGSENQDDEEEDDEENEDVQQEDEEEEWSDDMFETLDMHRLKGPRGGKATTGGGAGVTKNNAKAVYKAASSSSPSPSPSPSPSEGEHAAQDSSESSSVDIDLNRPLSAVSSKPPEVPKEEIVEEVEEMFRPSPPPPVRATRHHRHRFPIEEIDLNLPPLDLDCGSPPVGTTEHIGEVQFKLRTAYPACPVLNSSTPILMPVENVEVLQSKTWEDPCPAAGVHTVMTVSIETGSGSVMGTINLNDPLPVAEMMMMEEGGELDSVEPPRLDEQEEVLVRSGRVPSIMPVGGELVPFHGVSGDNDGERAQLLSKSASCTCGCVDSCKCQSRKRSLSPQEDEAAAAGRGVDYGKELIISAPKKRAITFKLPFRLNGLDTPNFIFSMHVAAMNSWARLGIQPLPRGCEWRKDWKIGLPSSVEENFCRSTEPQLPKCKIVEIDGDMEAVNTETDAENQASEGHVQSSLTSRAPLAGGQYGHVKRLRCHFSESEAPLSASYHHHSRSKFQRHPRKYTISFDSRSGKNRLLKAKERCSDWSWPQDGRTSKNLVDNTSCCSTSHEIPSGDSPDGQCPLENSQQEGVNTEVYDESKENDFGPRGKPGDGEGLWKTTSEPLPNEGDEEEINHSKSLPRDWKVPCLTLTAPGDSCDYYGFRQMQRTRGIRTHGRVHSHGFQAKSTISDFLNFKTGTKRFPNNDLEELDSTTKKTKTETSPYPLRSREEQDLLNTLCSMQQQKVEGDIASSEGGPPKLKGKRSARSRRRNLSYLPLFIFEGEEEEEVEEVFFVQPCTSQGPWQPTLPTTEKISRSPKLRRRRSDLPCKSSCVVAATSPVASGSKVASAATGNSSKGQLGSRLHGQNGTGWEEAFAAWNWPVHDVRFSSLRRQFSDGTTKTDRHIGRKVPARWNQYAVC
ncbi:unnamed protein product [Calypogeia fissa]